MSKLTDQITLLLRPKRIYILKQSAREWTAANYSNLTAPKGAFFWPTILNENDSYLENHGQNSRSDANENYSHRNDINSF